MRSLSIRIHSFSHSRLFALNTSNNPRTMDISLVVGLGNPGEKYQNTRHNTGFMFIDCFKEKNRDTFNFSAWEFNKKFNALVSYGKINSYKIILLKPQSFMNLSGESIKKALSFYKLKPKDLTAIHDDIDLPLGKFKVSRDASSAGHKGAQNIIEALGTQNFTRFRIGIENRGKKKAPTEKYVLEKFTKEENNAMSKIIKEAAETLMNLINKEIQK